VATAKKSAGKDIGSFRELHDKAYRVPAAIKKALAELGEGWEYEGEFLKRSGVSPIDLTTFREQFEDFWFEVRTSNRNVKRIWCGTKKFADKLKEYYS